jgi:ubiquinone/menaquinone biosynthesis C-methylase UbiE
MHSSLLEMDIPDEGFDIIWAEGSFRIIGFEKSLKKCRRLLKPNRFLVVHDATKALSAHHKNIQRYGFKVTASFLLPEDAWWVDYYRPLEIRINTLYAKYQNHPEALEVLDQYQHEVNMIKENLQEYSSAFYILQEYHTQPLVSKDL